MPWNCDKPIIPAANPDTYGVGLLRSNENFLLVEAGKPEQSAQAIIGLLCNDEKRRSMGENARRLIEENFSWDSVCAKTITAYKRVIVLANGPTI